MTDSLNGDAVSAEDYDDGNDFKRRIPRAPRPPSIQVSDHKPELINDDDDDDDDDDPADGTRDDKNTSGGGGSKDRGDSVKLSEKADEYLQELQAERLHIDQNKCPMTERLLEAEISKVQQTGRIPHRDAKYVDIYREKQIRVVVKVLVPVKEHPKFNFVGKLLGPKGNSLKRLQEDTMCKMAVLGRGSMKDRKKEEELRVAQDPKYWHLNDELHVEISAMAPPAEAHARTAYALAEVRKYLIPDSNDVIRQEQLRELIAEGVLPGEDDGNHAAADALHHHHHPSSPRTTAAHHHHNAAAHPAHLMVNPYARPRAIASAYAAAQQATQLVPPPPPNIAHHRPYSATLYGQPRSTIAPSSAAAGGPSAAARAAIPAKKKILSILDRARNAMNDPYEYDESFHHYQPPLHHHLHNHHPSSHHEVAHVSSGYEHSAAPQPPSRFDYAAAASYHGHHHHNSRYEAVPPVVDYDADAEYRRREYYHHHRGALSSTPPGAFAVKSSSSPHTSGGGGGGYHHHHSGGGGGGGHPSTSSGYAASQQGYRGRHADSSGVPTTSEGHISKYHAPLHGGHLPRGGGHHNSGVPTGGGGGGGGDGDQHHHHHSGGTGGRYRSAPYSRPSK